MVGRRCVRAGHPTPSTARTFGSGRRRLWGGWGWPGLDFTALESIVVVVGSLWLLRVAQQRLDRPVGWAGPRVSRSAYGAFMLQGIF